MGVALLQGYLKPSFRAVRCTVL